MASQRNNNGCGNGAGGRDKGKINCRISEKDLSASRRLSRHRTLDLIKAAGRGIKRG